LPLSEADLDPRGPGRAELGIESGGETLDYIIGPGPIDSRHYRRRLIEARQITDTDRVAGSGLETEENLKSRGGGAAPTIPRHAGEIHTIHQDAPARGRIKAA